MTDTIERTADANADVADDGAEPFRMDLSSPDFRERAFDLYAEMRAACPVHQAVFTNNTEGADQSGFLGRPIWAITGYDEGSAALLDDRFSANVRSVMSEEQLAQLPGGEEEFRPLTRSLLSLDPPDHTRLRKLVQPSFTARAIEGLRPRIQEIADGLLDDAERAAALRGESAPDRTMELIADYAFPLPITVIFEMLGIPLDDREKVRIWSEELLSFGQRANDESVRDNLRAFMTYLRDLFATKRQTPGDDMITRLIEAEEDGDRLDEDELLSMVFILIVAGHVTTVNLIASGVFALLTNPVELAKLRDDPALVKNAVEETLRYWGPAETTTGRFAKDDFALHGQSIRRGDLMMVVLGGADRDPKRFSDPDRFDISRSDVGRHIAFGKGIHACLGAPLARLEGQVALATLINRYPGLPGLRLAVPAEEVTWQPSFLRSLTSLPVLF